jgi:hypothetical protein
MMTMGTIFLVAYVLVGIAQIWAGLEGMQLYFGIGGFLAIILLFVAYAVPLVGTVGVAFLAYYGARYGWKWEWWLAVTLAVPGVILMLAASVTVGLAIWVQRLGWLISLHHQFAGAPAKTDSNRSKTNAFRKSRPPRAPNPRNRPAK